MFKIFYYILETLKKAKNVVLYSCKVPVCRESTHVQKIVSTKNPRVYLFRYAGFNYAGANPLKA